MKFRHDWTNNANGWLYRIEVIPYDANINDSDIRSFATYPADAPLRSCESLQAGFKDVPLGLCDGQKFGFTLAWSPLRSELKTYLRTRTDGTGRNTFLLFSNRGSGSTYTLDFAGVQPTLGGSKWSYQDYGLSYEIELIDIVQFALTTTTGTQLAIQLNNGSYSPPFTAQPVLWEFNYGSVNRSDAYQSARYSDTDFTSGFELSTFSYFFQSIAAALGSLTAASLNRRGIALPSSWFDSSNQLQKTATITRFFSASYTGEPRTATGMLDDTNTYLVTRIFEPDGSVVGGRWSLADDYAIAKYSSLWDWLKDFCEVMSSKVSYTVELADTAGTPYLSVIWRVLPAFGSSASHFNESDTAVAIGDISELDPVVIGRSEVRTKYVGDDNVTDYELNAGIVRTDRAYTVRCEQVNNLPSVLTELRQSNDTTVLNKPYKNVISEGLLNTNLACSFVSNTPQRCHEKTRIYYDASNYVEVDSVVSQDMPSETTPAILDLYALFVNEIQKTTGLPNALTAFHIEALARMTSGQAKITWRLTDMGTDAHLGFLGERLQITAGALLTELPTLRWDYCYVTDMAIDIIAGTAELTLYIWGAA